MEEKLYLLAAELSQLLARCMTATTQTVCPHGAMATLLPGCWHAPPGPWHPTKRLMVALCSLKGHIALHHGSHNCHVLEGKVVAETMTLLEGKAVGNVSRNICHVGCSTVPFAGLTLNNLL